MKENTVSGQEELFMQAEKEVAFFSLLGEWVIFYKV